MKVTRKGFSGPTAPISNMAYRPVTFRHQPYKSNGEFEEYQWHKAMGYNDAELAKEIKCTPDLYNNKKAGGIITANPDCDHKAPDLIEEMSMKKCRQNPEFTKRLIATYPKK